MDAKELRIGNCIMIDNELLPEVRKDVCIVSGIQQRKDKYFPLSDSVISVSRLNSWVTYNQFNEFINPIPLTEEWLLKFGFTKDSVLSRYTKHCGDYEMVVSVNVFSGTIEKDSSWFVSIPTGYGSQPMSLIKQYVHQLQNLYFALIGTELTISEQ